MLPSSSLDFRKALISSSSHTFPTLCGFFAVYSVHCSVCGVPTLLGQQDSNPLQIHNSIFHMQSHQLWGVWHDNNHHKGDHQPWLSLLGETSLDPWAGHCCSRVNSGANSLYSTSFNFILFSWGKPFVSPVKHHSVPCHSWACKNKWCCCTSPYHSQLCTLF